MRSVSDFVLIFTLKIIEQNDRGGPSLIFPHSSSNLAAIYTQKCLKKNQTEIPELKNPATELQALEGVSTAGSIMKKKESANLNIGNLKLARGTKRKKNEKR